MSGVTTAATAAEQAISSPTGAQKFWEGTKNVAIWLGRQIAKLWKNYVWPALIVIWGFLHTGFGIAVLACVTGITLLAIANTKKGWCRVGLTALAILCFIGTGLALAAGTAILL